jgi:predicted homoserine dehydrogenase-like protein
MGSEIVAQVGEMVGMEIAVAVDLTAQQVKQGLASSKKKRLQVGTDDLAEAEKAVAEGKVVVSTDYRTATSLPQIDVVIDATGSPEMGAVVSMECINHKKNIVMMNVECDVTIGPIVRQMAGNAGVVYSLAAGDEPAAIIEIYRFARAMGFEVVAAGKGKNNPLDIYATPKQWEEKARQRKMSARMLVEFVDGSKTMVEMAAVSNATGLVPDKRGMHGPKVLVKDLKSTFCPRADGGVLSKKGCVDYAIGDVAPGIFVIVTTDNQRIKDGLAQRDMGEGPYYLLYRPYHLCSIEVPLTVAQGVIYGESSGHPRAGLVSECITVAKRDLQSGEVLDGIGEYCYHGSIELADVARKKNLLPLGLAKGCVMKRDVGKDTAISYDMVDIVNESVLLQLRKIQDQLFA